MRALYFLAALGAASLVLQGCRREGCLGGEEGCRLPTPCEKLAFSCDVKTLSVRRLQGADPVAGGLDAIAAAGDIQLSNGVVTAVIAGIGNANLLDPNGGSLLDLSTNGDSNDSLNQVLQVVGILPADAARYTTLELVDEPARVGVQLRGTLDGKPELMISTLYELRPCDRGLRIRTEVINGSADPQLWALSDGFYWSGREALPFTPAPKSGFSHPSFDLLTINDAFERFPYLAASGHAAPYASYAEVACREKALEGFQSDQVSSAGMARTVVPPRGYLVFERFLAAAPGAGTAPAIDVALDVRSQLFGEQFATLTGKVARAGGTFGTEREASILVIEPDAKGGPIPWSQVVPDATGAFSAKVPSGKALRLEVHAFGQKVLEKSVEASGATLDVGELTLPSTARVTVAVTDAQNGMPLDAEVFVVPANAQTKEALTGTFHGRLGACSPWLGPPSGSSPACNRFLVSAGQATVDLPVGELFIYAFKGPFWTLQRKTVTLTPTVSTLAFALEKLPLQPAKTVTADCHVHGAASFDSSIPDEDRVRSFSATDLEVIVATDHDVVYDYSDVLRRLGLQDKMTAVVGMETTGHIPFMRIPDYGFPLVIGHYNFWPLKYQPNEPHNGGVDDERVEPGALFDAMASRFDGNTPVIQLNHPWATPEFGRDLGFPRALALDARKNLPAEDDGTAAGMYVRAPNGKAANNGHHAQEVMNGTQNDSLLPYRAFWFYLLSQGQLRAGTANSDSHSLTDNTVGLPRNVVYADTQGGPSFKVDVFNRALRNGELFGTNGPVIEATVDGASGGPRAFSLSPFTPAPGGKLRVKVSAAPWVPVQEVRIVVNGAVKKTITALASPADPFGKDGLLRYEGEVPLAEVLPASGDAWLVVEAGRALPLVGDLGGVISNEPDGIPDTSDNNGDGVVDRADVREGARAGPLANPPLPETDADPQFHFSQVVTEGYPFAFTNPFILDRDGNGKFDAPRVEGSK